MTFQTNREQELIGSFFLNNCLDFLSLLWYCVVLTGGAVYGKHYKRAVARQYHTARGQSDELKGEERAPWVHGKASRGLREKLHGRAEGDLRKVPRLLE